MIHLAKFSAPAAARAEELVAQIAAAVQGLSEVAASRNKPTAEQPKPSNGQCWSEIRSSRLPFPYRSIFPPPIR